MKKFLFFTICLFFSVSTVQADDFHKYYRPVKSSLVQNYHYDELNRVSLKIKSIANISTKKNLAEGQKLVFLTTEDTVLTSQKVLPAGSRVFGRVETISMNGHKGIPANLIIGNFKIEYMPSIELDGEINKQGSNRSIWVRPFLPILFAVKGGHAKIKTDEIYEIYYTPKNI